MTTFDEPDYPEAETITVDVYGLRYEYRQNFEPDQPGQGYFITEIELIEAPADDQWPIPTMAPGRVLDSFMTDSPASVIAAYVESQEFTLEERLGAYGLEWEREQRARQGVFA